MKAAQEYDDWPHRYRHFVYYRDAGYRSAVRHILENGGRGYTLLKVTRDPTKRLVSIFRHACRFPILQHYVWRTLGFDARSDGLSLADFRSVLSKKRLLVPTTANPHLCAQYHPVWDLAFDRTITVNIDHEDLNSRLNEVEVDLGLDVTDFAAIPALGRLKTLHYARHQSLTIADALETHRFRPEDTAAFPKRQFELLPYTAETAVELHGVDFDKVEPSDVRGKRD